MWSHPNAAYVVALIGALFIYVELARPGKFVPGLFGTALFTWGCYLLSGRVIYLPGFAMVVSGLACLCAEAVFDTRLGGLIGGVVGVGFGSSRLVTDPNPLSGWLVWPLATGFAAISFVLARSARIARTNKRRDLVG